MFCFVSKGYPLFLNGISVKKIALLFIHCFIIFCYWALKKLWNGFWKIRIAWTKIWVFIFKIFFSYFLGIISSLFLWKFKFLMALSVQSSWGNLLLEQYLVMFRREIRISYKKFQGFVFLFFASWWVLQAPLMCVNICRKALLSHAYLWSLGCNAGIFASAIRE